MAALHFLHVSHLARWHFALQGAIAGGVVGGVVALAILAGVAVYVAKRRQAGRGRGGFKFSSIWNNSAAADNRLPLMT